MFCQGSVIIASGLELVCLVSNYSEHLIWHMQSADTLTDYYKAALVNYNDTDFTEYGLTAFDAVYVAALGMNASVEQLREGGLDLEGFQFEDFNRSAIYADILRNATGEVDFRGVTVSTWELK